MGVPRTEVEDLVSVTGAALWEQRAQFAGGYERFVAFGVGIARHKVADWKRSRRQWDRVVDPNNTTDDPVVGVEAVDLDALSPEEAAAVGEVIGSLSPQARAVLERWTEGWTWDAIAAEQGGCKRRVQRLLADALAAAKTRR